MEFKNLKNAIESRYQAMKSMGTIYRANIDRDFLWQLYLDSFPEGTNPIFRERADHDCSTCRSFIKNAGSMVVIVDGELQSIWDVQVEGGYQVVVDQLAEYVKACPIDNVFLYSELNMGQDKNIELTETGSLTWEHLHAKTGAMFSAKKDIGTALGNHRTNYDVVLRSLQEIKMDSIEVVLDLISQGSLYRGDEKRNLVTAFSTMKKDFDKIEGERGQQIYAWSQVVGPNSWVCRIRNDVIGTLLVDLSDGVELEVAVKSFEDKVSGTNYKRPTALVTPKMRDAAKEKIEELGLMDSLDRRYAKLEDIKITDVLFADRNTRKVLTGDVFEDLPVKTAPKKLDSFEEVTIDKFISDILPNVKSLQVLVENQHRNNLVSLIAPEHPEAPSLFKWGNPFSWSYTGDVADSIKERVKAAGGNVTGDVCCRLAWFNHDDLDLHMLEPIVTNGHREIYYGNKRSGSGGELDVDMNAGSGTTRTPVENIFYKSTSNMPVGVYELKVQQYHRRETTDVGFEVEIDVRGEIHSFSYNKAVTGSITVARLKVNQDRSVEVIPVLESKSVSKEIWNIKTEDFCQVSAIMLSPNFWDNKQIGNKHFFFMLEGCKNDGSARGFYNEFLTSELEPHRKTMELVGSRVRTEESDHQMSGLGFSSTQKNSLVVRVQGSFQRTLKITF